PTALPTAHEPMLLLAVTDFVANSAASVYFTAGALRRNISADTLPRRFPLQLRTKSLGVFSPQLQERYPDQPMELLLSARRQPLLRCRPDALHGALFGSAEAFVVLPNATRVPAFVLNIVSGWCCHGTGELCPACSSPGWAQGLPVPQVKRLETLLKFGLWLFGVPWANSECCP
ncbi:LBP protein, partial [Nyctibius grandis]|nr:LBP protein [Nyctibius grandis]